MRIRDLCNLRGTLAIVLLGVALLLTGCGSDDLNDAADAGAENTPQPEVDRTLVIGNVDASNPSEKIEEFQPLVDYLVALLEDAGVTEGSVVIAPDTAGMARMLESGEVDIYIDSALPAMDVCTVAGCEFALRQWRGGVAETVGVFVTSKESGISSLDDLRGKVIMLEQPHSTVGHILPLTTLVEHGLTPRLVDDFQTTVADDEVGYYVSSGGQTSMNLLLNGDIAALAIGERGYGRFSPDVLEQVEVFDTTLATPSQLVAFRPDFDPELEAEIVALLLALEESDEGQAILKSLRDTAKFDALPEDVAQGLDELYELVQRATGE